MKLRRYEVIRNCLAVLLNYLVALSIWSACDAVFYIKSGLPVKLAVAVMPYLLYAVRSKSRKLWSYFTLHVLIATAFVCITVWMCEKPAISIIVIVCLTVLSFSVRVKSQETKEDAINPIGAAVAMLISFLAVDYIGDGKALANVTGLALTFAVLYVPYMYICRFLWFDFVNRKTITQMPSDRLFKAGFRLALGISGSTLAVLLAVLDEQKLIELGRKIRSLLRRFLEFLLSGLKFENTPIQDSVTATSQADIDLSQLVKDAKPSPFLLWLEKVVMIAATIIAVLGIIFLAAAFVVSVIRRFKGLSDKHTEEVGEDIVEVRESIKVRETGHFKRERLSLSAADRIRRMYIKIVRENAQYTDSPEKYTAREFADFFDVDRQITAHKFCKIYEKARYSETALTRTDLKEAKIYCRELSE